MPPATQSTSRISRRFTRAQANSTLVYIGRVVEDVVSTHAEIIQVRRTIEKARGNQLRPLEVEYRGLINRLRDLIRELDAVGVDLRDFEKGVIEFPPEGRELNAPFQWRPGMPAVVATLPGGEPVPEEAELLATASR